MQIQWGVPTLALLIAACGGSQQPQATQGSSHDSTETQVADETQPSDSSGQERAVASLSPTEGHEVRGSVTFLQTSDGVTVTADVEGLTPGDHGFHIHETGDCSAPDGTSAGGHFNPGGHAHGAPTSDVRHAGDLGNLSAGTDGTAHLELTDNRLAFDGPHSIVGRGIIVHASADDLTSQPTGAAGARVACGVIEHAAE